jgi:hypothetical protein
LVTGGDLTLSADNPEVLGGDADGIMYISPSTSTVLGGNIALYGNTHASKANDIEFRDTAGVEFHYDSSGSLWDFQANAVTTSGVITGGGFTGALTGNADTATTLATTRAIAVAGDVTGTANFDGSAAISITTTLATDAIITANITDNQVTLAKMAGGTANSIVSYDGSGDPAELATGISNTNVLVANAAISDDDFLRVDGTSIEGRSASELASDIGAASIGLSVAMAIAL